jgi:hypothetical protein
LTSHSRQPKPLKRVAESRPEFRTIVVFTEGKKSEPDYVNELKRLPHVAENVALNLELRPEHGVPLTLVQLAVERKMDQEVDECWCIFDVEWPKNHPNLNSAILLARANDIRLAISNPCFEVWLILHHKEIAKFNNTAAVESASRALDKRSGKSIDAASYMPHRRKAAKRAQDLDARHERDGTKFPHDNPSSGMYKFLMSLEDQRAVI